MAKLRFQYGTMNSKKTADLLAVAHSYTETNREVILITSKIDTRDDNYISSRIGIKEQPDLLIDSRDDIIHEMLQLDKFKNSTISAVLVDEVQFLTTKQIDQLSEIVDILGIPVMAYGLKTDFRGKLFPASQRLLELSDELNEVKSICWYCNRKATMNLRLDETGKAIITGATFIVGGNESYVPACRRHYKEQTYLAIEDSPEGKKFKRPISEITDELLKSSDAFNNNL